MLLAQTTTETASERWIDAFRQLMEHCVPPIAATPEVIVGALFAIVLGIGLVFRGGKFERQIVMAFALLFGGYLGYYLSNTFGLPGPITIAITSIGATALAFKTYKLWLATGSVVVLFAIGMTLQLGRGDLSSYLPQPEQMNGPVDVEKARIQLPTPEQQQDNQNPDWRTQLSRIGENIAAAVRDFDFFAWILPITAAVLGAALAYWALQTFAILWLGFLGANLAVLAGCTLICCKWPDMRDAIFGSPHVPAYVVLGLWVVGLIWQAKEARFPKKILPSSDGDDSGS